MRAAVVDDQSGRVENVIVVESEDFDPGEGMSLHVLADDDQVTMGWTFDGGTFHEPPRRTLTVDRGSIVGDGADTAVVSYSDTFPDPPEQVVFTANGATKTVQVTAAGNAFLDVASSTPGDTIVVTVDALPQASVAIVVKES